MIKLTVKNNKVPALLRSDKDFVKTELNEMTAQRIISNGKVTESDIKEYPISVNDEWFFAGKITKDPEAAKPKKEKK